MAENMENQEVIDVGTEKVEETGLAAAKAQTEPEKTVDKAGVIGKVCTGIAVVSGLISIAIKGYRKGKQKKAKNSEVIETEPTSEEDEVQE
jgi:hypothetical protein